MDAGSNLLRNVDSCLRNQKPSYPKRLQHLSFSGSLTAVVKAVDSWPGYAERYSQKLRALADILLDRIVQVTQRDDTAFNVLNHGDLWVNNMLFRYSDAPDGLRFLDFQLLHFSSPAIDLQYFFNTSPSEEVRQNYMDRLIEVKIKRYLWLPQRCCCSGALRSVNWLTLNIKARRHFDKSVTIYQSTRRNIPEYRTSNVKHRHLYRKIITNST